ncbi:MAG TPA: molybdenum cofactor guanylyltransferase [Saprospiraceae bacterium]|nr:molybdenum cofactor guanylyltransferase [Saprospiraceae bacterium]
MLHGLILAGGQSSRMGTDKALLSVREKAAYLLIKEQLRPYCNEIFISCRSTQEKLFPTEYLIRDAYTDIGPMAGILSAMESHPQVDWLVVATDMLLVDSELLDRLFASFTSTDSVFFTEQNFVEPLCGIYHHSIYDELKAAYHTCQYSLSKLLRVSPHVCLLAANTHTLKSFNEPAEFKEYLKSLDHPGDELNHLGDLTSKP